MSAGVRLGVDYGAGYTAAVLVWPDGRWQPLLFDGVPELPSAVGVGPRGDLVTGADALRPVEPGARHGQGHGGGHADRHVVGVVMEPKRHLVEGSVVVGLAAAGSAAGSTAAPAAAGSAAGSVP